MALFMVRTVCWWGYAALDYGIRQGLKAQEATLPDQQGKRSRNPTARWVLPQFAGIHVLRQAGQWPMVLSLTEVPQHLRRRLGQPYMRRYDVRYSENP